MSYFTDQGDSGEEGNYLVKLVAEKGEQWKEPEAIAKGYLNAQEHIQSLERKNAELLEDVTKARAREEVLEEMRKAGERPASGENLAPASTGGEADQTSQISPEQIKSLVDEALTVHETRRTSAENLAKADEELTKRFGTETNSVVSSRAKELGLTRERLTEIASESPSAFLRLIGEAPAQEKGTVPRNDVNTQSDAFNQPSDVRSWEWYQELRRKNPKEYYSAKVQRQLEEDYAEGKVVLPT
jgi:hypothetical protein